MHLFKDVTHAEYVKGFQLLITFDDGIQKIVDLENYLTGEVFFPLGDIDFFKNFIVNKDTGTIEWSNQADFGPDFLYEIGKTIKQPVSSIQHE